MAQQTDPNAPQGNDTARAASGGGGAIAAGSADSYRAPGFKSPALSTTGNSLSGIAAAPGGSAPLPTQGTFGKWTGAYTPGILAATQAGGTGVPGGSDNYSGIGGALGGLFGGNLFKQNNSQLQDIGGALYQGLPITDADWANAGYGPGGATLAAAAPTTGVRGISTAPANTIPTNAVLKY
jgi:hypothetical protein